MRHLVAVAALGLTLALQGCFFFTSRTEGNQLLEESRTNRERSAQLEQKLKDLDMRLQGIEGTAGDASRRSADLSIELQNYREKIAELEGTVAELRYATANMSKSIETMRGESKAQIEALAAKAGLDATLAATDIPADTEAHFQLAMDALKTNQYGRARTLFREYAHRHPDDAKADDAQYYVGVSYLRDGRPAGALGEFQKVIASYPKSDVLDKTLLDMSDAFIRLGSCTDAKNALSALQKKYPKSAAASQAKSKLQELKDAPGDRCTS